LCTKCTNRYSRSQLILANSNLHCIATAIHSLFMHSSCQDQFRHDQQQPWHHSPPHLKEICMQAIMGAMKCLFCVAQYEGGVIQVRFIVHSNCSLAIHTPLCSSLFLSWFPTRNCCCWSLRSSSSIQHCHHHLCCSQEETARASTAAVSNVVVIVVAILGCFQEETAIARAFTAAAASNIVIVILAVLKKKLPEPQQQQQHPMLSLPLSPFSVVSKKKLPLPP